MKRLFILAVLLLANTVVVSAWVNASPMTDASQAAQEMTAKMSGDMPCHDMADTQNEPEQHKHCDGLCWCLHASLLQHITTNNNGLIFGPDMSVSSLTVDNDIVTASAIYPPYRPPISIS